MKYTSLSFPPVLKGKMSILLSLAIAISLLSLLSLQSHHVVLTSLGDMHPSVSSNTCFRIHLKGRLGNLMFEVASLVGVCVKRGLSPGTSIVTNINDTVNTGFSLHKDVLSFPSNVSLTPFSVLFLAYINSVGTVLIIQKWRVSLYDSYIHIPNIFYFRAFLIWNDWLLFTTHFYRTSQTIPISPLTFHSFCFR